MYYIVMALLVGWSTRLMLVEDMVGPGASGTSREIIFLAGMVSAKGGHCSIYVGFYPFSTFTWATQPKYC